MYVIYGRPGCRWCVSATRLAYDAGVSFDYIDISENQEAFKFITEVIKAETVPQIFHAAGSVRLIGGFDEFKAELQDTDPKKDVPENDT